MEKKIVNLCAKNRPIKTLLPSTLEKKTKGQYACCVLITCKEPTKDGQMDVELSFEGDEVLASFLIQNASQLIEEQAVFRQSK